jgi:putative oxidoreductase
MSDSRPSHFWNRLAQGDPDAAVALVRVVVAVVVLSHPLYDLAHPGTLTDLGRTARPALGPAAGVFFAWVGVLAQIGAATALLFGRRIVAASTGLIVLWSIMALVFQWPLWFVAGGDEVTGHPGVEFNALVIACLAAILVASRQGADSRGALDVVRIASAIVPGLHGAGALLAFNTEGMRGWGQQMEGAGFPFGVALVWSVVTTQTVASCALLSRRLIVPACAAHIFILVNGIWTTHAPYWFVVGPGRWPGRGWSAASGSDEGGMEFSVVLIACFTAVLLAYARNPWRRPSGRGAATPSSSPRSSSSKRRA